jgi:hypothetical protein
MLHFTKYAEKKFGILNEHKVFFRREEIEGIVLNSDKQIKKGKYYFAEKDRVCVVFQVQGGVKKIISFYPLKK